MNRSQEAEEAEVAERVIVVVFRRDKRFTVDILGRRGDVIVTTFFLFVAVCGSVVAVAFVCGAVGTGDVVFPRGVVAVAGRRRVFFLAALHNPSSGDDE